MLELMHSQNTIVLCQFEEKNAAKETRKEKREIRLNTNFKDLESQSGQKRKDAAKALGISVSTFKRRCREYGIKRWPENENHKKNPSLFMRESANESAPDSQRNMGLSSYSDPPPSDTPLQQNASHADPESSQGLVVQPKLDLVVIKAKYENNTIKFEFFRSAGIEKFVKEVGRTLNFKMGSIKLKYLHEDNDEILLACDGDL